MTSDDGVYPRFELLIFDHNGTLMDDFRRFYECGVRRIFAEYGVPCPSAEQYRHQVGPDWMQTFYWPNGIPRSATARDLNRIFREGIATGRVVARPFLDASLALSELRRRGYRLALVSSLDDDLLQPEVEEMDLARHFESVVGGAADKSLAFREVTERLLGAPQNALLGHRVATVGDMVSDSTASLKIGAYPFLCPRGFQSRERLEAVVQQTGFGRVISDFYELLRLLP